MINTNQSNNIDTINNIERILTKTFTKLYNGAKGVYREVNLAVNVSEVRELDSDWFVHGSEVESGVCMDSVLVQCVLRSRQPFVACGPPECVI